jgi:hypothetical protein
MSEESLQMAVCKYIDLQYPNIIYTSDLSGIKLTIGSAIKARNMRCKNFKIPDLLILEPSGIYHGLIIELKKDRDALYCKSGNTRDNKHVNAQLSSIKALYSKGYLATFACGFDEAKNIIDNYFKK